MSMENIESMKVKEWKVACQELGEGLAVGDDEAKARFDQYVNSDEYHLQARALSALLFTAENDPEVALNYLAELRLRGRINQIVNAVKQEIIATQPQLQIDDFLQERKLNESRLLELLENAEVQKWDRGLIKHLAVRIAEKGKDGWEFLEKLAFGDNERKIAAAKLLEALAPDVGTALAEHAEKAQRLIVRLVRDESAEVWDAAARAWGKAALTDETLFLWLNKALLYSVVDRAVKKPEGQTGSFDPWQRLDDLEPQIAEILGKMNQAPWRVNIHIQRHSVVALGVVAAFHPDREVVMMETKGGKLVQRKGVTASIHVDRINRIIHQAIPGVKSLEASTVESTDAATVCPEPNNSFLVLHDSINPVIPQTILLGIRFPAFPIKPIDAIICPKPYSSFLVLYDSINPVIRQAIFWRVRFPTVSIKPTDAIICPKPHDRTTPSIHSCQGRH